MPPAKKKPAKPKPKPAAKTKGSTNVMPHGRRADYGASIEGFFAKQPKHLRVILEALNKLIAEAAPKATSAIKWGMPFYTLNGKMMCALGAHKAHVNLILVGPPAGFKDKDGRLEGAGKGGRHLKLTNIDELPRAAVRSWLRSSVKAAKAK